MPFRSKSQIRKLAILERNGHLRKGTVHRWAKETKNIHRLPERLHKRKTKKRSYRRSSGRR